MSLALTIFILSCVSSAYAEDAQSTAKNNNSYVSVHGNDVWDGSNATFQGGTVGPKATINGGISVTNNGGNLYIANGTYSISEQITINQNLNIYGGGMNSTIIDGSGLTRIFEINEGKYVNITSLTIRNGKAPNGGSGDNGHNGGAIDNQGTLLIDNCNIYNNAAGNGGKADTYHNGGDGGDGGAIYNEDTGVLTIQNSLIHNNKAGNGAAATDDSVAYGHAGDGGSGGGICNLKTLTIINCEIYNNQAGSGGQSSNDYYAGKGGKAGAIYNKKTCNITYTNIHDNISGPGNPSGSGGAIYNTGTLNITGCTLNNNKAAAGYDGKDANWSKDEDYPDADPGGNGGSGGAILNSGSSATLTITGSSITNNSAGNGGNGGNGCPCFNDDDANPKVSFLDPGNGGNGGSGGGIYNDADGTINSIINTIINNNNAGNGGIGGSESDDAVNIPWYKVTTAKSGNGGSGGGIYSEGLQITIQNSTINNNAAGNGGTGSPVSRSAAGNGGDGGNGGGLVLYHSIQNISNCQINNNRAGNGGKGSNRATDDVNPSTKPGNGGNGGNGGGIYFYYDTTTTRTINITNSTMDNNTAGNGGAGGIDDYDETQSSNGGNGGKGGAIAIVSKSRNSSPSSNLHLIMEECNIAYNQVGIGGQPYKNGNNGSSGIGGGLYTDDYHAFTVNFCRIVYNTPQAICLNLPNHDYYKYIQFPNNWWGSNSEPKGNFTVIGTTMYTNYYSPWLVLNATANPNSINRNQNSTVTTNLLYDNTGGYHNPANGHVPDGIPLTFGTASGAVNPQNSVTASGASSTTFTPNISNTAIVSATVDDQTVSAQIQVIPTVNLTVNQLPWFYDSQAGTYQTWSDYNNVLVYLVEVKNTGPDDATGVIIKELIGNGYEFVGLSTEGVGNASYDQNTRTITWNIANMLANTKVCLSIFALVTGIGNNTPELTVNASLNHVDQYDTPNGNKSSSWSIYVPLSADIQVNQTQQNSNESDGQYITYTVTVSNNGPSNATAIQITDILPVGLIINSVSGNYVIDSNSVIWTIDNLNIGENTTLTLKAKINSTGTFINTVTKTAQGENDWNYNNNAQTCIFTLSGNYTPEVNMNVYQDPAYYDTATGTYQKESEYYKTIVYSVEVKNNGPTDATGVIVIDVLGEGYDFINCTTRGVGTANYDPTTHTLTWNVGYVPVGGKAYLSIYALVTAVGNNTPELTVNASLSHVDQYDIPNSHKWASYSIYVPTPTELSNADQQSNLYIKGTLQNITANLGKTFTTTLKLGNYGPHTAKNVIIKIPIPEGLEFITASVDQGTWYYDQKTRTVIWYVGDVKIGDPYITFTFNPQKLGNFVLNPIILTHTYNRYSGDTIIPLNIQINNPTSNANGSMVNAASRTIGMQETGLPIAGLILAILAVFAGLTTRKK